MSQTLAASAIPSDVAAPRVRRLHLDDLTGALRDGVGDFLAIPTQLVFLGLLYPVIGFAAVRTAIGDLVPLLFPLVAGLSLVGPVLAVGLYELSRRREAGLPVSWLNAFDVRRSAGLGGIVALGVGLFVLFAAWLLVARGIFHATIHGSVPGTIGGFVDTVLHAPGGWRLVLWGNLAGFGFAVVALAVSVVSFPMMLDRGCSPLVAVRTSLRVVAGNPAMMAAWGLVVAGLLALGSIPVFVGLAVTMPILGHATWHLYRRAVG